MSKLIFASPTYGPVEPAAVVSHRTAIMNAAANGHEWIGDASPNRMKFDVARNAVASSAVDSDADFVFWCDSDVVLPPYAITKLLMSGKDFVTGIYHQREGNHMPLIAIFNGQSFSWVTRWPESVLAPIDGCGFGCVLTSVEMLRKIADQGIDTGDVAWFNYRKYSEDFDFCLRAKEVGYQLFVDTSVSCGHLAEPKPMGFDQYRLKHPEFFKTTPVEENGGLEVLHGVDAATREQAGNVVLPSS